MPILTGHLSTTAINSFPNSLMEMNCYAAEEIGIHVGDGSMNIYSGQPSYTLACHHIDDKEYIDTYVVPLFSKVYGITPKPRPWSIGSYGFRVHSRKVIAFKKNLGLPLGKKDHISIPQEIITNEELIRPFLRGLFDTDGSITLWQTNGKLYPRIYFVTISELLFKQVIEALRSEGFRVTFWENTPKNPKWKKNYRISINGVKMLEKWAETIGFHNPKNIQKLGLFGIRQKCL